MGDLRIELQAPVVKVGMTMNCHNHTLQTNLRHHEEETQSRQLK